MKATITKQALEHYEEYLSSILIKDSPYNAKVVMKQFLNVKKVTKNGAIREIT